MYELDFAFYSQNLADQGNLDPPVTEPPASDGGDPLVGGEVDTMWVRDLWIIHGEEMWVAIEYARKEGGRYEWTGEWKKIEPPEGYNDPTKVDGE